MHMSRSRSAPKLCQQLLSSSLLHKHHCTPSGCVKARDSDAEAIQGHLSIQPKLTADAWNDTSLYPQPPARNPAAVKAADYRRALVFRRGAWQSMDVNHQGDCSFELVDFVLLGGWGEGGDGDRAMHGKWLLVLMMWSHVEARRTST